MEHVEYESEDGQGFSTAVDSVFDMHHLGHARAALATGGAPSLAGLSAMKAHGGRA